MQLNRLIIRGPLSLKSWFEIHFVWNLASLVSGAGARFSKVPIIINWARLAVAVYINDRGFNSFASNIIKSSGNETKWSSLLARTRAPIRYVSLFEYLISDSKSYKDFRETGPWPALPTGSLSSV